MEKRFISKFFLVILLLAAVLFLRLFWTYISAIVLGLLVASAFYPLYSRLKVLLKNRELAASLSMTLMITLILIIPVGGFIGTLSNEAFDFYHRSRSSVSLVKIREGLNGDSVFAQKFRKYSRLVKLELDAGDLEELASSVGKHIGLFLSKQLRSIASNLLNFLIHFFLMTLVIYYMFKDGVRLKAYLSELLPLPRSQQELVVNKFREVGRAVILGNGFSGIVQGVLGGFGFALFGLGSPFLWGTVIGFLAFLPIIGASLVFLPATLILFLQGESGAALGYLSYNAFYSIAMEYFIKPRVIGKGMRMNPLLVFVGILGGMKLFGILGVIYGPLIMTIFLTLAEIYRLEYKEALA